MLTNYLLSKKLHNAFWVQWNKCSSFKSFWKTILSFNDVVLFLIHWHVNHIHHHFLLKHWNSCWIHLLTKLFKALMLTLSIIVIMFLDVIIQFFSLILLHNLLIHSLSFLMIWLLVKTLKNLLLHLFWIHNTSEWNVFFLLMK